MASELEARVRRLPKRTARWLFGYRRLGIVVGEDSTHPYLTTVVSALTGALRATDIQPTPPGRREASELLLRAMHTPAEGSGEPYRPTEVAIEDAGLYRDLAPLLQRVGVQAVRERGLAMLDAIAQSAETALRGTSRAIPLVTAPDTTPAQFAEYYAAAAEFFDAYPWEWLGSADPIAVRYPADAKPVYVMLVAGSTERPGLNICLTRDDLEVYWGGEDDEDAVAPPDVPVLIMFYSDASPIPVDDLDAIGREGWIIRDGNAYPLFFRAEPPDRFMLPSSLDIWRMAAILRTLPTFISAVGFDRGMARDAHETYFLPAPYPERSITLTYPHDLPPGVYVPTEPFEEMVAEWCPDNVRTPLGLVLALLAARILGVMHAKGYSPATIDQYSRSFHAIGWLLCRYGPYDSFSTRIFEGEAPLVDEFRRYFSPAKTAIEQYRRAWRRLGEWVHLLDALPPELLEQGGEEPM